VQWPTQRVLWWPQKEKRSRLGPICRERGERWENRLRGGQMRFGHRIAVPAVAVAVIVAVLAG